MTGLHESTLALSVYNALARLGLMDKQQIVAALAAAWDSRVDLHEVGLGINYLVARKMVTVEGDVVAPTKLVSGAARTVIRHPQRLDELIYGPGQAKSRISKGLVLG